MSQDTSSKTTGQAAHESEEDKARREAGTADKSSHDHTSREKAGTNEGVGGGAKQQQQH
jgi:hypothetical protein